MLAANKLENVRRRVNRARRFPDNTCPASRHVHIIAEMLVHGRSVDPNEYEHVAGSLLSVLESLWKARTRLEKLDPRYGVDELAEAGKRAKSIAAGLRIE